MTQPIDTGGPPAYTRASVVAYLEAAEVERRRLRRAIGDARARTASARSRIERLDALGLGTGTETGTETADGVLSYGATSNGDRP